MATVINKVAGIADSNKLQRANTMCCLGDSIAEYNLTVTTVADHINTKNYNATGFFTWANVLLGSRLKLLNETDGAGGVGGDGTDDMLARVDSDVIAYDPGWCIVLGGVNDVASRTAAAIKADLESIYTKLLNADINVVAITFWENTGASWTDAMRAVWLDVNQWIREYCRTNEGMFLVDGCALVTSAAAMPAAGSPSTHNTNYTDGVHPRPVFARILGQEIADTIADYVPPLKDSVSSMMDRFAYNSAIKQMCDNPMLQQTVTAPAAIAAGTTGTGVSGTVAAGCDISRSTGVPTVVASLVTDPSPEAVGNAQRMVITASGGATPETVWMRYTDNIHNDLSAGDEVYMECYIKVSGTFTAFRGVVVHLFMSSTTAGTTNLRIFADTSVTWSQDGWEGLVRTPAYTYTVGDTPNGCQPRIYAHFQANSSDTVTVDVSRLGVYRNKGT